MLFMHVASQMYASDQIFAAMNFLASAVVRSSRRVNITDTYDTIYDRIFRVSTPSGLEDVSINDNLSTNDKSALFAEALQTADNNARLEVQRRQRMQERLANKEKDVRKEKQAREHHKSSSDKDILGS
jgi:hypothetical protein